MAKIKLTYFDFAASRGEECRLSLYLSGVDFEDERLSQEQWAARKATAPFGALPIYTVEGHPPLAQSNAILRLIGQQNGLHPKDEWESARHEAVMGAIEDMRTKLGPIARIKDADEKKRARLEVAAGYLPEWGAQIERQIIEGPFLAGNKINVADLKLFVAMGPFVNGKIDHIPGDVWKNSPKMIKLYEAVKAHPKVVAWYAR